MIVPAISLALSFILAPAGPAAPGCEEWLSFDDEAMDQRSVAFYDRKSGAYVTTSTGGHSGSLPWPNVDATTDHITSGGRDYLVQRAHDARAATIKDLETSFGLPLSALGRVTARRVAPLGAELIVVRAKTRNGTGSTYSSAVCSEAQRERVMDAIIGAVCLVAGDRPVRPPRTGVPTLRSYEELRQEASLDEIRRSLGSPTSTYQAGCNSVALVFSLKLQGSERPYEAVVEVEAGVGLRAKWIEGPIGIRPTH